MSYTHLSITVGNIVVFYHRSIVSEDKVTGQSVEAVQLAIFVAAVLSTEEVNIFKYDLES